MLGAEQAGRAAGMGAQHLHPALTVQGCFGGVYFPVVKNWASLLFVSHMGSQMDGEEGAG